jgi:MoaA/NifB/PqqE/SkfB family radical SAM enzyme
MHNILTDLKRAISYLDIRKHSFKRIGNFVLAILQWKLLKNSKLMSYPIKMTICPGNICNLKCALCPTGKDTPGRKKGMMGFELFKKVIDECGPYIYKLDLYNWGEPFLNKDIFKMIKYAKTYRTKVEISSNLNVFSDEMCKELLDSGLDVLTVSLDGASQKSVSAYQKGGNFEQVIANIKNIVNKKKELNTKYPLINWRFLVNKYNEHEIGKARELAKELDIDNIEINKFRCDMGTEILMDSKSQVENVKNWLPKNEALSMYDYSKGSKKVALKNDCNWLWTQSAINWDGSVSPCCAIWHQKFDFGKVNGTSFFEIWNNEKYKEARMIISGKLGKPVDNICYICKKNSAQV